MNPVIARATGTAVVLALGTVVFAQSTPQVPAAQQPPTTQAAPAADQVTITGCVQTRSRLSGRAQ